MANKTSRVAGFVSIVLLLASCASDEKKSDTSSSASSEVSSVVSSSETSATTSDEELSTAAMVPAIQRLLDLGAATSASAVDLDACPLGDFEALVAKAPAEVIASASLDGEILSYVYQPEGEPPHLQCGRGDVGAYTGLVPAGDYKDELIAVLPDFVLTFDDDVAYLGGTIVSFCAEPIGVGAGAFCETDWHDGNVWVGVFIDGDASSSELSAQWLTAILWDVVTTVPQLAPTVQLVG